jgi:(p)ppGpp synthase/HD superfamily hydrolase
VDVRPQTNVQLLNDARSAGYPDRDVAQIKIAHDFVAPHFAGWFRASGKPFIAHLVGTAGILCAVRVRTPVVVAGLAHAIYAQGELPALTAASPRRMRAAVRRAVGDEAETLVARYDALPWNAGTLPGLRAALHGFGSLEREVVLIRLANELDDHLDLAMLYHADADERQRRSADLHVAVDIAKDLGFSELAASLDRALELTRIASVPRTLRSVHSKSFRVAAVPHWERGSAWIRRAGDALLRRCVRLVGRPR